jgi:TRAP-type C4-dicarboxylate transport system substrate-binding protein
MRLKITLLAGFAVLVATAAAAAPQEIKITVGSGHPPLSGAVKEIRDLFIPEVDKRLAASGKYKITWTEAYAGTIAKPPGVLKAVEDGAMDVGHVPFLFNGDKLPLEQITYVTPFGPEDSVKLNEVILRLRKAVPEMDAQLLKHKQILLAPLPTDAYQIVAKKPVSKVEDLRGMKLGTAGQAGNWVRDTGVVAVSGDLTTFYNSMQTGVYEGIITFDTAVSAYKFYEVAPYIVKVGFGAQYASGLTVNERRWKGFPQEVKDAFLAAAPLYEKKVSLYYKDAGEASLKNAVEKGAKIVAFPAEERAKLAKLLPNIAKEWAAAADAKGLPGTKTLVTYMQLCREAGIPHARQWDKE